MGKKRRVWWIVGGAATAFTLFVAIVYYFDYNSPEARLERAVAQIVEKYGFVPAGQHRVINEETKFMSTDYSRAALGEEKASEIVAQLRAACPDLKYSLSVIDKDQLPENWSGGMNIHKIRRGDLDGEMTGGVTFSPNDRGGGRPGFEPVAMIRVLKLNSPSLWQKIKEMLL